MSAPDPLAKLRRFVPLLALVILLQAGFLVYASLFGVGQTTAADSPSKVVVINPSASPIVILSPPKIPAAWPLVAGDLVFTGVLLFFLWRLLGRKRG